VNSDRVWRWIWIGSILAVFGLSAPLAVDLYSLREARRDGDLPKSMRLVQSLSEGFFGPILSPWLDSVSQEIRSEVVESNLLSIQRLVPDSEESAYAELELGRLALDQGNATEAAVHLERYLKSGLGRDVHRAKMDLAESYREMKRHEDALKLLTEVIQAGSSSEIRSEAAFHIGELLQFYLSRPKEAESVYRRALADTAVPPRWKNDILTNLSLLKE